MKAAGWQFEVSSDENRTGRAYSGGQSQRTELSTIGKEVIESYKVQRLQPLWGVQDKSEKEQVVVTCKGRPIAALVSIKTAGLETIWLSTDRKFLALIERWCARQRGSLGVIGGRYANPRLRICDASSPAACG